MGFLSGIGRGLTSVGTDMQNDRIDREGRERYLSDRENERSYNKDLMRDAEARRAVDLKDSVKAEETRYQRRLAEEQETYNRRVAEEQARTEAQNTYAAGVRQEGYDRQDDIYNRGVAGLEDIARTGTMSDHSDAPASFRRVSEPHVPSPQSFGDAQRADLWQPPTETRQQPTTPGYLFDAMREQNSTYDSAGDLVGEPGDVGTAYREATALYRGRTVPAPDIFDYQVPNTPTRQFLSRPEGGPQRDRGGPSPASQGEPPFTQEEWEALRRSGIYDPEQLRRMRAPVR